MVQAQTGNKPAVAAKPGGLSASLQMREAKSLRVLTMGHDHFPEHLSEVFSALTRRGIDVHFSTFEPLNSGYLLNELNMAASSGRPHNLVIAEPGFRVPDGLGASLKKINNGAVSRVILLTENDMGLREQSALVKRYGADWIVPKVLTTGVLLHELSRVGGELASEFLANQGEQGAKAK